MSVRPEVLVAILLCAAVTVVPRVLPLLFSQRLALPALAIAWLRLMPPAILVALLVPGLFIAPEGGLLSPQEMAPLLTAAACTILAFLLSKRNFMITFLAGVVAYAILLNFA